jgi:hypothetical protein
LITAQNGLCGDEPPPFDFTILSSIPKYELQTIDHSIPAKSGTVATWRNTVDALRGADTPHNQCLPQGL